MHQKIAVMTVFLFLLIVPIASASFTQEDATGIFFPQWTWAYGIPCGAIFGGSDADFCADAGGAGNYPGDVFVNTTGDPMTGDLNSSATISANDIRVYSAADYVNISSTGNVSMTGEICFDSDGGGDACISDATNAGNVGELFFNAESIITPDYLDWYFCANGDGSGLFEPVWQADCAGFFYFSSIDASLKPNRQFRLRFPDNVRILEGNLTVAGNITTDNKVVTRQGIVSEGDILIFSGTEYFNISKFGGAILTGDINLTRGANFVNISADGRIITTGNVSAFSDPSYVYATGQNYSLINTSYSRATYVYDANQTVLGDYLNDIYVNETGDTMTGDLVMTNNANITDSGNTARISVTPGSIDIYVDI